MNARFKLFFKSIPKINKRYFALKIFQFIAGAFGFFSLFAFVGVALRMSQSSSIDKWHHMIGLLFYSILLYDVSLIIKRTAVSGYNGRQLLKNINLFRWLFMLLSMALLTCSIMAHTPAIITPNTDPAAFFLTHTAPEIINPNMGYFVITFLIFYLSYTLSIAKNLKEEQELTI